MTETRNRKRLGENELSDWELRIQDFRVFYDVVAEEDHRIVNIKSIVHNDISSSTSAARRCNYEGY